MIEMLVAEIFLLVTSFVSIIFGVINAITVYTCQLDEITSGPQDLSEHDSLVDEHHDDGRDMPDPKKVESVDQQKLDLMITLADTIINIVLVIGQCRMVHRKHVQQHK